MELNVKRMGMNEEAEKQRGFREEVILCCKFHPPIEPLEVHAQHPRQ